MVQEITETGNVFKGSAFFLAGMYHTEIRVPFLKTYLLH